MPFLIPIGLKLLVMLGMGPGRALQTVSGRLFGTVSTIVATLIALGVGYATWRTWLYVHDGKIKAAALAKCEGDAWKAVEALRVAQADRLTTALERARVARAAELETENRLAGERVAELETLLSRYKAGETRPVCVPRDVARVLNR